jgi:hypothetical protein
MKPIKKLQPLASLKESAAKLQQQKEKPKKKKKVVEGSDADGFNRRSSQVVAYKLALKLQQA